MMAARKILVTAVASVMIFSLFGILLSGNLTPEDNIIGADNVSEDILYQGTLVSSGDSYAYATQDAKSTPPGASVTNVASSTVVAFAEIGLLDGTHWSVIVNGTQYSSDTQFINVTLVLGSLYSFSVSDVGSYYAFPSNGTFFAFSTFMPIAFMPLSDKDYGYLSSLVSPSTGEISSASFLNLTGYGYALNQTTFSAYDPNNGYLFAAMITGNLSVINVNTNTLVTLIPLPANMIPFAVVYNDFNDRIYVTAHESVTGQGHVYVLDPQSLSFISDIIMPFGNLLFYAAVDTSNGNLYVPNELGGNMTVISGTTNTIVTTVQISNLPFTYGIAYDKQRDLVYVSGGNYLYTLGG